MYKTTTEKDMTPRLTMLGTGSAFPQSSYNTCFIIRMPDFNWMVDAGGGNGILKRMAQEGIEITDIRHLFITHAHTDHILGVIWIIRSVINLATDKRYTGKINIYGNTDVIDAVKSICRLTLLASHFDLLQSVIAFHNTDDRSEIKIHGATFNFFDCSSKNVRQTGFTMTTCSGLKLVCMGDEALTKDNNCHAADADWVMCGAFCRDADKEIFKPYEKHHFTVKDVAMAAAQCNIKNLILYHCEDRNLDERERLYRDEAGKYFKGITYVPTDGDDMWLV